LFKYKVMPWVQVIESAENKDAHRKRR
jgi:hypothetical protein